MMGFNELISALSNWLWGWPMRILLFGGGVWLTVSLGFFQFKYCRRILRETFGKIFSSKKDGEGTISPFQATTAALASTVGAANIIGVSVAVAFGGPGAIFWMWVVAAIGCASKFSEIALGVHYREKNARGEFVGGPMYYLKKGVGGRIGRWLSLIFSFCLMLEIIPSIATQSLSVVRSVNELGVSSIAAGTVLAVLVGLVVFGGITRIGKVAEVMVPAMAVCFIIGALMVLAVNLSKIPEALSLIFRSAFTPAASIGGFGGAGIIATLRWGIARGTYSNEAGMGTAPVAHSTAVTDHPCRQACWGIFEIVADTMIICTVTGLAIIVSGAWTALPAKDAATMPLYAFSSVFGDKIGSTAISISLTLFVISTIITLVYYGEKQAEFLFGYRFSLFMRTVYVAAIFWGALGGLSSLFYVLDILLAMVIIPNMIGLLTLTPEIKKLKNDYFSGAMRWREGKFP
jgi:AGCS family alanine or glycine:cation symporter